MTYQVLARKWRPCTFEQLVGQTHVTRALSYALTTQKLHHAYLFSGTRGVGKTTIARIIAKCLNCEQGITAQPCGTCATCIEVDAGTYVDLIEVDAASRTRVEDTRELLENVAFSPMKGRYKIYLIDEVHMLSGHSFNALLKTLEEPPSHIIFLLATTDPERLPITVVSRCLQFHLRAIAKPLLIQQLENILQAETIAYEPEAIGFLAQQAQGSLRDALSLLEQAIAIGQGTVSKEAVELMLGCSYQAILPKLLHAVCQGDTETTLAQTQNLYESGADFAHVLDAIISAFHAMAVCKAVAEAESAMVEFSGLPLEIIQLHREHLAEQIQLFYDIALKGKQDLPYAPDLKMGFEMILLRLIHFRPFTSNEAIALNPQAKVRKAETKVQPLEAKQPTPTLEPNTTATTPHWSEIAQKLSLVGLGKVLVQNCVVAVWSLPTVKLILDARQAVCLNEERRKKIEEALSQHLKQPVQLTIQPGDVQQQSPQWVEQKKQEASQSKAEQLLQQDKFAQKLIKTFDATVEHVTLAENLDNL